MLFSWNLYSLSVTLSLLHCTLKLFTTEQFSLQLAYFLSLMVPLFSHHSLLLHFCVKTPLTLKIRGSHCPDPLFHSCHNLSCMMQLHSITEDSLVIRSFSFTMQNGKLQSHPVSFKLHGAFLLSLPFFSLFPCYCSPC